METDRSDRSLGMSIVAEDQAPETTGAKQAILCLQYKAVVDENNGGMQSMLLVPPSRSRAMEKGYR